VDSELVVEARKIAAAASFMEGDSWQGLCLSDPDRALRGLDAAATNGDWSPGYWKQLLWSHSAYEDTGTELKIAHSDVFLHKLTYFQSVNGCNRLSLQQNLRMNHLHVQRLAKLYILMPRCVLTLAQFWQKILKQRRLIESGRFTVLGNKRSSKSATKRKGESWRVLVHKSGRLGVDR
jgi:hypothetical protein